MLGQASFSDLEYASKKRRTRRELFLAEMDVVVPWPELLAVVEPHYPRAGGRGRPPVGLASMLRIYFLQQVYLATKPAKCSIVQPALRQPSIAPQRNEPRSFETSSRRS